MSWPNLVKIGRWETDEKCRLVLTTKSKTNLKSLDFPINRFFIKLFNTSDMQTITECQMIFGVRQHLVLENIVVSTFYSLTFDELFIFPSCIVYNSCCIV